MQLITRSNFLTKLLHWEYWPASVFNIPIVFMWLFFAARARSLFFFTTVNPVIETGGFFGESKIDILKRMPEELIPKTLFIGKENLSLERIEKWMEEEKLEFPIIVKPNIGERGLLVKLIDSEDALEEYLKWNPIDLLVQEYVDLPIEISITHYQMPNEGKGRITSVCLKEHLKIWGDGKRNIKDLILAYPRARLQLRQLKQLHGNRLERVPPAGEQIVLVPIGNHSRGAMFLNANKEIDEKLTQVFDDIASQMKDIYFGRFDLKCSSFEALRQGVSFKILEFNGVAADPAHVFDPGNSIWSAYKDYYKQWKIIYEISKYQRAKGIKPMSLYEMRVAWKKYLSYQKQLKEYV